MPERACTVKFPSPTEAMHAPVGWVRVSPSSTSVTSSAASTTTAPFSQTPDSRYAPGAEIVTVYAPSASVETDIPAPSAVTPSAENEIGTALSYGEAEQETRDSRNAANRAVTRRIRGKRRALDMGNLRSW